MEHAEQAVRRRLEGSGLDAGRVYRLAASVAERCPRGRHVAVLLVDLPGRITVDEDHPNGPSNGDQVWAIVRDQRLATIMLRRASQPATPDALRVDIVTKLVS